MVTDGLAAACPISPLNHAGPIGLDYHYLLYQLVINHIYHYLLFIISPGP